MITLLFYVFSFITIASAMAVVSAKDPVHSVLFLILAFFNAAGLFILLRAELLAMLLVIVYVGAVAVLFLFVVMMLNVNTAKLKDGFVTHLPIGLAIGGVLAAELFFTLNSSVHTTTVLQVNDVTNTRAIGNILYTDYVYPFQITGLILLVAMIGAIVLTHRKRDGVRKQNIADQIARRDTIKIVKVKTGEGI